MGLAGNSATFMRKTKRGLHHFLALVSTVSTLSAISITPATAADLSATDCPTVQVNVNTAAAVAYSRNSSWCVLEFKSGSNTFTVPSGVQKLSVIVVGGGGGGGGRDWSGGGGAGEVLHSTSFSVSASTTYSLSVGGGGNGSSTQAVNGSNGSDSNFGTVIAKGGGGGAGYGWTQALTANGSNGGSGGGAAEENAVVAQGGSPSQSSYASFTTYGNRGGNQPHTNGSQAGSGGGGAGGAGGDVPDSSSSSSRQPGAGGAGIQLGAGKTFSLAGGGGGGSNVTTAASGGKVGVTKIGGDGGNATVSGGNGSPNTGSGGGGGGASSNGGNGGSGLVVVAFAYSITYDANNATSGSVPSGQDHGFGSSTPLRTNTGTLARTGYTFAGWNTQADGLGTNYAVGATYATNASLNLYAKWTGNSNTVVFNSNGGSGSMSNQTITSGTATSLTTNTFTRAGYSFSGWNTNADGTSGTSYSNGQSVTIIAGMTLYAKWALETYTITFAVGANGSGSNQTLTKTNGTALTLPNSASANSYFTRAGYTVTGWTTTDGSAQTHALGGSFTTEAATTLYPVWGANTNVVTFDANGGSSVTNGSFITGSTLSKPNNPTKSKKIFGGWSTSETSDQGDLGNLIRTWPYSPSATSNITLYAIWHDDFSVSLAGTARTSLRAGNQVLQNNSSMSWEAWIYPTGSYSGSTQWFTILDNGYTGNNYGRTWLDVMDSGSGPYLSGGYWVDANNGTGISAAANSITYNSWQHVAMTVERTGAAEGSCSGSGELRITLYINGVAVQTANDATFAGCINSPGLIIGDKNIAANQRFIGRIDQIKIWDGVLTLAEVQSSRSNYTSGSVDNTLRAQYGFNELSSSPALNNVVKNIASEANTYDLSIYGASSLDVTSNVSRTQNSFQVSYDGNTSTSGSIISQASLNPYEAITTSGVGNLVKTGYTLSSWNTLANGTGTTVSLNSSLSSLYGNTTLYAQWTANSNTVTFNANDGSGSPATSTQSITTGVATTLTANSFTRTGYTFAGWNTAADGSGSDYTNQQSVTITAGMTLYAKWTGTVATLSALTLSSGTLSPTFASATTSYTASVANSVSSITVTPTRTQENATITVNGTAVTSGSASGSITLSVGSNTITIVVTAQSGSTTGGTYTLTVTRLAAAVTPTISTQPVSMARLVNEAVTFTVVASASDSGTLTYQWQKGGVDISGATSSSYTFMPASTSDAGDYRVLVTNTKNSTTATATSNVAKLAVAGTNNHRNFVSSTPGSFTATGRSFGSSSQVIPSNNFTIEGWFNESSGISDPNPLFSQGSLNTNQLALLIEGTTNDRRLKLYDGLAFTTASTAISSGKWNHFAVTYDGSTIKIFLNGVEVASKVNPSFSVTTGNFSIGQNNYHTGHFYHGKQDQVKIWSAALTANEIASSMHSYGEGSVTGKTLRTLYDFNLSSGNDLTDVLGSFNLSSAGTGTSNTWVATAMNVIFDEQGGSAVSDTTFDTYTKIADPGSSTRTGYTLAGWSTTSSGTVISFPYIAPPLSAMTLYAIWTGNSNTVTFNANDGSGTPSTLTQSITSGIATALTANSFTRTGYTFAGWDAAADGSGTDYTNQQSVTITSGMTLYAKWTANSNTVTFNANDGSGSPATTTQSITTGSATALTANTFTRIGYTFAGWDAAADGSGTDYTNQQSVTINSSMTLYAKWTMILCSVTGDTSLVTGFTTFRFTETCFWTNTTGKTIFDIALVGGGGGGGYGSRGAGGGAGQVIVSNTGITVSANQQVLIVVGSGGQLRTVQGPGNSGNKSAIYIGTTLVVEALGGGGGGGSSTANGISGGSGGGGSGGANSTGGSGVNTITAASTSSWTGYVNNGGAGVLNSVAGGGGGAMAAGASSASGGRGGIGISLWSSANSALQVAGGGSGYGSSAGSDAVAFGGGNASTDSGAGVCNTSNCSGAANKGGGGGANGAGGTGVVFFRFGNSNTVTFNANDGSGSPATTTQTITSGVATALTANSFTRSGYTFVGWDTQSNGLGTDYTNQQSVTITSGLTLYAQWTISTFVITLAAGTNGTGSNQTLTKTEGSALTLPDSAAANGYFTRTGYTVSGWSTTNGGSQTHTLGGAFTTEAATTLYPVWTANTLTVTFDSKGGSSVSNGSVAVGATLSAPTAPTKSGSYFLGWSATDGGVTISFPYTHGQTSNFTLYAIWTAGVYSTNLRVNLDASNRNSLASDSATTWNSIAPGAALSSVAKTATNAATSTPGALNFSNTYVNFGHKTEAEISGDITVEAWIKLSSDYTTSSANQLIASHYYDAITDSKTNDSQDWYFRINAGRLQLFTSNGLGVESSVLSGTVVTNSFANNWILVGFTQKADGKVQFYLNGLPTGSEQNGNARRGSTTAKLLIGAGVSGFVGSMSKFRMYAQALTADQIKSNFNLEAASFSRLAIRTLTIDSGSYTSTYATTATGPTLTATASDGIGTKTFTSATTSVCTVNSSTGAVTLVTAGTCTISATIAADSTYDSATSASISFTVTLATRTITIDSGSFTSTYATTATAPTITSTASAGTGTKSYSSSTTSVCTIDSSTGVVTFVTAGTCTLTATIAASATHASASSSSISFTVSLATQTVTWSPTLSISATASPATPSSLASALGSPTITYAVQSAGTTGCTVNSSTAVLTFTAPGSCTVRATAGATSTYAAGAADAIFTISAAALSTPSTPTAVATAGTLKSIAVSWTAVTNTTSYTLKLYATDGTTLLATITGLSGTTRTITATDYSSIADNTAYKVSITAIGSGNYSSSSESSKASVTTASGYTLTYSYGGATSGNADATASFNTGASALTLPVPAKTGYAFDGWYEASDLSGTKLSSTYTPTQSRTIYAKWIANTLVVTFDSQGGTSVTAGSVLTGANLTAPTPPTKAGYTFSGWSTTTTGSTVSFTGGYAHGQTASFTLYAIWSADTNIVIFNANNGSGTMNNQSITTGASTALTQNSFTRAGYVFGGWNTNADGASGTGYNDGQSVSISAGMTLYAKWYQDNYLEFLGRGDVAQNTAFQLPTNNVYTAELWWQAPAVFPSKTESFVQRTIFSFGNNTNTNLTLFANTNHSFNIYMNNNLLGGYSFSADKTSWHHLALVRNGSSLTFYFDGQPVLVNANLNSGVVGTGIKLGAFYDSARWGDGKFDQFKVWDVALTQAQLAASSNTYNFSADTAAAANLILHYDFNDGTGTTVPNRAVSANYNLSIVGNSGTTTYTVISPSVYSADYSVIYNGNNSTGGSVPSTQTKLLGTSLILATNSGNLVRIGYTFAGWNTSANGTGTNYAVGASYSINNGITLFAKWTADSNTVSYNNQGATTAQSGGSTSYVTGAAISAIPTTAPIRLGYTFTGWFTASTGGTQVTNGSLTPATPFGTVTLYAQWTANSLTITYNSQGGTTVTSGSVNTGTNISAAPTAPTRTGYTFSGWSATSTGSVITFPYTHGQTSNFTLYAIWSADALTITYDSKSGTSVANGTVNTGASISAAPTAPTRTGYTLSGWSATDGGPVVTFPYAHGQTANFTLYAIWAGTTNTITYNSKGGSSVPNGSFVTGGNIASAPTAPTRAGYTLSGWSLTDGGAVITYPYTPTATSGITLYAIWSGISCSPTSTTTGGYTIYTFTTAGTCFWTVPNGLTDVEILAVAGGGGGGYSWDNTGAGGGAGGQVKTGTATLSTTLEVTVGGGGTAGTTSARTGGAGGNSVVGSITALGGTGGCAARSSCSTAAQASSIAAATGGAGGIGGASGRGGGGSNTAGSAPTTTAGGTGVASGYSGTSVTYGVGGAGGTARAGTTNIVGTSGSANTGNGGAGASAKSSSGDVNGGAGGSGLVVVRVASALTVTYDSQSGSSVSSGSTATGASIATAPTDPTRSNYTFLGWFTATSGGSAISFPYAHGQTADFTLYARWALNTYAIAFNANNGSGTMANQTVTHGTATNLNANLFTRANYVFHRWATAADGTGTTYNNLAQVTLTAGTTLYAQWTANTYVVTYNYNNATGGNSTTTSSFTTGGTAIVLPTPTRTGYTFAGWFSDAGLTSSIGPAGANYSPTGSTLSLSAYAKWTAINYTFTYDGNSADSGTVPTETSKQITQTATVSANTGSLVRAGYTFSGWNTQSNGGGTTYLSGSIFTVQSSNVTLYAKWSANTYTVTYNSNGGTGSAQRSSANVSTDSYTTGGSAIALPGVGTLERAGYTFGGWNTSAAGTGTNRLEAASYTTVSNTTLYAKWNPVTYSITYDGNGSDGGTTPTTGGYTTGQASPYSVGNNTFTKTLNVFGGWNTAANGSGTSYSPGASITTLSNIVLYATWIPQYTLHYAINGGTVSSGSLPDDRLYNSGTSVGPVFSSVSRTGYTFGGWSNGSSTVSAGGSFVIAADSVLTAIWNPINYSISYESDGGSTPPTSTTKQIGQSYTVGAAVSKPGYNFAGWSNGSSVVGAGAGIVMGSSDVTYTAQWVAQVYTVSYDWNGGRGTAVSDVNYTFGTTAITLPLVGDRVKDGYTFAGWSESSNGSALGATYIPSQSRTLYALWNIGNFTVTYDAGRGTVANSSVAVQNGGSTVLPLPTRANFVFNGWHTAVTGGTRVGANGDSFTPSASQTVYARWIQSSLYGITDSLSRIGSVVTSSNIANTFSGANSNSSVAVSIPANALPAGTTINFDLVSNSSRATGILSGVNYLVSIALSWLTGDETVPDTAADKPISVTISNSSIKAGAAAYAIVNNVSTLLGTATQDGVITVSITSDPEIVVAATKPTAPTNVAATSNGNRQSVISWSAPTSDGGSAITGYTVTSNTGATCTTSTTSCTISSLTNGTGYTFTVTATNTVGTSVASTAASATTASLYTVTFDAKGGTTVTSGSFLTASTVSEPTAPTRTGYSFAGWAATDGGSAEVFPYAPGVTTNITMYARWDALDHVVTFDSKSGSAVADGVFASGGTVTQPTSPTRSGYTFAGWSATDGGAVVTFPYAPGVVTDITLYAKWSVVSQNSSSGSGGGSSAPAPAEPSTPGTTVKSNVTVVPPVTVVGDQETKGIAVQISTATGADAKPPVIKLDAVGEKIISEVKVVDGKLVLTPETGFSGKKTVTVTVTENGADRIIQIPLTVLPEPVTKPVLTPTASNKTIIRWTESPNADAYSVYLNGKKICSTEATSCSVNRVLGPDSDIQIISNGGDRTISTKAEADFKQVTPVQITRLVSATVTKATLSRVDTRALDKVIALIKSQGFGTVVISEITTTSKTKALADARLAAIKKYIDAKTGSEKITFEVVPPTTRTFFNNIAVKG